MGSYRVIQRQYGRDLYFQKWDTSDTRMDSCGSGRLFLLMVVKRCSPGCKAVNVFTVLPLSVARDCWTCEDSETHCCDDNVSLFLQCECRTEDPSSPDA